MNEKEFLHEVMKKDMPDFEQVRKNCLNQRRKISRIAVWKQGLAIAVISVIIVCAAGTGISYATTGENPVKLFQILFNDSNDSAVSEIEDDFVEINETIEAGNMQYTLERYFFDKEQGIILAEEKIETTDNSPLISWEEAYAEVKGLTEAASAEEWKQICTENEEEYKCYKEICENLVSDKISEIELKWPLYDYSGNNSIEMVDQGTYLIFVFLNEWNYEEEVTDQNLKNRVENSVLQIIYQKKIKKEIKLKDTGKLKSRDADESKVSDCRNIVLKGNCLQFAFSSETKELPFKHLCITMKDGSIYAWNDISWVDIGEVGRALSKEEEKAMENNYINISGISSALRQDQWMTRFWFEDYINVDDVVSLTIDGTELLEDE